MEMTRVRLHAMITTPVIHTLRQNIFTSFITLETAPNVSDHQAMLPQSSPSLFIELNSFFNVSLTFPTHICYDVASKIKLEFLITLIITYSMLSTLYIFSTLWSNLLILSHSITTRLPRMYIFLKSLTLANVSCCNGQRCVQ
jgi:hypothetical protein